MFDKAVQQLLALNAPVASGTARLATSEVGLSLYHGGRMI